MVAQRIRIIAGEFGGRLLEVPEQGTRPLADRVRQALFVYARGVVRPALRHLVAAPNMCNSLIFPDVQPR
ncbi:MAG: Conserved hypothetical protein 95 [Chloroflexota bacterium]